ncbi:TFIIB-type zinc ribbon-containing protein [Actinomadura craniellae]|uniref:TFIIB-type zinc ribbon-containing protein n=1 Tax=Actinomadura craniellae TaxID=2231787 RepID=A0A365HCU5_9ACTN|nr:TFIIB-type zinc ribbon-containing protein [Actinomadura craniellae]RAY16859.1 TFIIB-type zinc ribbon-containing protein [Actinomadura craniellae]
MNAQSPTQERFTDPAVSLYALAADPIHVVCPACAGHAEVVPWLDGEPPHPYSAHWPRRLVCRACGHARNWRETKKASSCWGGEVDPYFRQPLWLCADCCGGHTLWAFNERHLDILENYVSARLRERGEYVGMTMLARLPAWLKSAKHRTEILRTIGRLRASLPR